MISLLTFFIGYCVVYLRVFSTCVMVPMSSSLHVVTLLQLFVKAFFEVLYCLRFVCSCFSLDTISDENNCNWRFLWRIVLYKLFAMSDKRNDICNLRILFLRSGIGG